jgi:hypothetical protein
MPTPRHPFVDFRSPYMALETLFTLGDSIAGCRALIRQASLDRRHGAAARIQRGQKPPGEAL